MRGHKHIKKVDMTGITLTSEADWIKVTISPQEIQLGIEEGTLQEEESKRRGLKDRTFSGDEGTSLDRSIAAKQAEYAVRRFGGGTARVTRVNEFHDFPDVGGANVRYTFNTGYGLIFTNRDQNKVPMILVTGKCPDFYLMGWHAPGYAKQIVYKVHQGRTEDCQVQYGFLQEMKDHEACQVNMQMLMPMAWFPMHLIK